MGIASMAAVFLVGGAIGFGVITAGALAVGKSMGLL